jgi:predicted alpha/beta superfamily hydrolase
MKTKLIFTLIIIFGLLFTGCNVADQNVEEGNTEPTPSIKTEIFSFTSNGSTTNGKIYLPDSYETNANLPAIYLIDFRETAYSVATDEFEEVIEGVKQIQDFDALVVTLEEQLDEPSTPGGFQEFYTIFKDMASYVDSKYTNNTSRTFIGRGSEAGVVSMALFLENPETSVFDNFIATDSPHYFNYEITELIESGNFPQDKGNKRFHYSFSATNDYRSCTDMINKINDAEYPWLQFKSKQYFGEFITTYPAAFAAGIKYVFNK